MMSIRPMREADRASVLNMMRVFYASPAVHTDGSEEIFQADVSACVGDNPYAEGFVFEQDGTLSGYSMIAKSFSTEFGKLCIWIEDLYLLPEYRRCGAATQFIQMLRMAHPNAVIRLEAEEENMSALAAYHKNGMKELPYVELILL